MKSHSKPTAVICLSTLISAFYFTGCKHEEENYITIQKEGTEYTIRATPDKTGVIVQLASRRENNDIILHPHQFTVARLQDGHLVDEPQNSVHVDTVR